jgi:hypothetical protein
MTVKVAALSFDAIAPARLARFWSTALAWDVSEVGGGSFELVPTDATGFGIRFRPDAHAKVGQNRIHLDLTTRSPEDQASTVAELLAIGATHVDVGQGPDEPQVVLADPEGNELCIIEPANRFLASCPRLGAVNCDGSRALGHFFGDALGWPLVWDQDEETAIQAPDGTGPKITWSGPPLMPRPAKDRLHLHVAPTAGATADAAIDRLIALGATRPNRSGSCPDAVPLIDVDGNQFCLDERSSAFAGRR